MKLINYKYKLTLLLILMGIVFTSFEVFEPTFNLSEKIYVQTDRSFYFPDETIWFKAYVVNNKNETSDLSDIAYAELITPKGSVVKRLRLRINNGYTYGDFTINKNWVGGVYTLKMYTNWMRNYGEKAFFTKKITVQKIVQPKLLLNLKFQEEAYGKSSWVTAIFEAKDLKNNPLANIRMNYKVAIEGAEGIFEDFFTDASGKKEIKFQLPDTLNTSDVTLNVLIPHQGSIEAVSRSVPVVLDKIDLQFFSESGKAIAQTINKIAFKAVNEFGKPADVSGIILDTDSTEITTFKSFHDGMGSFEFIPEINKKYYALITSPFKSDSLIKIPKIKAEGVKLNLISTDEKETTFKIYSSSKRAVLLQTSNATQNLSQKQVSLLKGVTNVSLDTHRFPMGITRFSVYDDMGNILCERLVFINKKSVLNIQVIVDKKQYEVRKKTLLKIKTTDKNNIPIPANLSLSVADNKLISFADDKQDHIISSLLVSSELKGKIHNPVFYFDSTQVKANKALDYVMLTHGWRDYIKKPLLSEKEAIHLVEKRAVQYGSVVDKKGKPISANLLLFDNNGNKVLKLKTDAKGQFSFRIDGYRHYTLVAYRDDKQGVQIRKRKQNPETRIKKVETKQQEKNKDIPLPFKGVKKPIQEPIKQKAISSISLEEDAQALDEVIISAYGVAKTSRSIGYAVTTIRAEDLNAGITVNPLQVLQGKVSGVQITNASGSPGSSVGISIRGNASISGNNQPLYIVDGIPFNSGSGNELTTINSDDVASINILKGTAATNLYGSNGVNGVIIINTKSNTNIYRSKKLTNQKFNNYTFENFYSYNPNTYYNARAFYIPIYDSKEIPDERTDFRQTIYWNPVVQTDEKGEASLEFYNSDAISSFKVTTEGIGYNGLIGRKEINYSTKKLLNVDFKAPNYLSLNDTIILPIVITNETKKRLNAKLTIQLPEHIKIANNNDLSMKMKIDADSFAIRNIAVIPVSKNKKSKIIAVVESENYKDSFNKTVEIISPYFSTEASISGFKNKSFILPVNNVVPNSLVAEFNIYTDVVGDVMNGIESLIRQPWGCFEQVSSATYPNILVLKYLKEMGKSNPEIEQRAHKFIKQGYRKLAGYETSQNGFEWYGKTPPHEALSAYGLMEFTEMKEVYKGVDDDMIKRTVKWLLSRRDGKGGFKQKKGKYGFSGALSHINNAYIVYAISESGVDIDIEKEYITSWNEALKSNDSYRMALMALASFNLGKRENASILLEKIKSNIEKRGFSKLPVENTITRSYGNAKKIETAAFTILSLLREKNDEDLVAKGIEFLLENRKYGRFGSTQSTSMALKALIAYTRNQKTKIIDNKSNLLLKINQHEISQKLSINKEGKIVIPEIGKYIKKGLQEIDVEFTNPEINFPYSLDIKWDSFIPNSSNECKLNLSTKISQGNFKVGDNVRLRIEVSNKEKIGLPMTTAIIGIPSGTTAQPWQLKELIEKEQVAYYEVFDNYLVFYWRTLGPNEVKTISLDLKADVAGNYTAPASTAYLYYTEEFKHWIAGNKLRIRN